MIRSALTQKLGQPRLAEARSTFRSSNLSALPTCRMGVESKLEKIMGLLTGRGLRINTSTTGRE